MKSKTFPLILALTLANGVFAGEGGQILLVNGTDKDWELEKVHSYQMNSWYKNFPKIIKSGQTAGVYVEWEKVFAGSANDSGAEARYKVKGTGDTLFEVQARNGSKIQVELIADTKFPSNAKSGNHTTVPMGWNKDGIMNFVMAGRSGSYMTSSFDTQNWMRNQMSTMPSLRERQLADICLPGSHDSGMSASNWTVKIAPDSTVLTQTKDILGQLKAGCRFFDIRPAKKGNEYFTAHLNKEPVRAGAGGQKISDIISQVNAFAAGHDELIILMLSHAINLDNDWEDFSKDDWNAFLASMSGLKNLVVAKSDVLLPYQKLGALLKSDQKVIVFVNDDKVSLGSELHGKGFFTKDNFAIYDSYADKKEWAEMRDDQLKKMKEHGSEFFLLSWTLTQQWGGLQAVLSLTTAKGIYGLADEANNELTAQVYPKVAPGSFPNILYIDKFENSQPATLAAAINWKREIFAGYSAKPAGLFCLREGKTMTQNQRLNSSGGGEKSCFAVMQDDGNFCIYETAGKKFVWDTKTGGNPGATATLQDGNFVIYGKDKVPKWSSQTHPAFNKRYEDKKKWPVKLVLEDAKLKLYNASGEVEWESAK